MKIVIVYNLPKESFQSLTEAGHDVVFPAKVKFTEKQLFDHLKNAEIVVSTFTLPFTKRHIDAAPKLKMIANYGVGFNTVDVDYASKCGIIVTNTPNPVIEPTAELAMALMLAISRRITFLDKQIRVQYGLKWGIMENLSDSLQGKTLGIVGMGNIGQALARRALAFGMHITYHNRKPVDSTIAKKYNAHYMDFASLLKTADYISLNAPYTKETHHIIDTKELDIMKDSAYLINTARGPLIHEEALVHALKSNIIAGAALDVFENEPSIHQGLLDLDNVILMPHVGTATIDTRIEIGKCASRNILNFISGSGHLNRVN